MKNNKDFNYFVVIQKYFSCGFKTFNLDIGSYIIIYYTHTNFFKCKLLVVTNCTYYIKK